MNIYDTLKKDEVYSIMCLMLYATSDNPRFATLNELAFLTDHKSFLNILKFYEGQTIQIPTLEESQTALRIILLYHYYYVEKDEYRIACDKVGIPKSERPSYLIHLENFCRKFEDIDYKAGGLKNVIKGLKT